MTWQLSLTGLLIGLLVGATGMGGGSLMTPVLVFVFGFNPTVAVGTDIVHGAIFKTFGALRHRQLGTVQGQLSGWMLLGSAPMSLAGVAVATWLSRRYGSDDHGVAAGVLGAALVLGALGLVAKAFIRIHDVPPGPFVMRRKDRIAAVAIGLVGGFVVGLTSVGSGVFFALTLLFVFPLRAAKVVGTDVAHAAALLGVAGVGHMVAGNVDGNTVAWLLIGSIPGVLLGSNLAVNVPDRPLRLVLASVLAVSGAQLMHPSGTIVVLPPLLGLVLAGSLVRRRRRRPAPAVAAEPFVSQAASGDSISR